MNNDKNTNTNPTSKAKTICKLAMDTHAGSIMVARQLDGLNPQPPQRMPPEGFLKFAQEQVKKGYEVITCYEAGPTGYWLHRKLVEMGITHYVVCPTRLDSRGKGVNTDKTDAAELLTRLDRYVAGNKKAFSIVRVPTPAQEQKRALCRLREQLRRKRLSFAARFLAVFGGMRCRRSLKSHIPNLKSQRQPSYFHQAYY
jgi:hypothetical protein